MEINCTWCKQIISLNAKVVIDEVNSVFHSECYGETEFQEHLIEWKDFGKMKDILVKHGF